jgi:glycosyltransferase involved in cell wall biosynthesis
MKVAIVHDDLVQWGGAERVLEAISELYSDSPIYTSVFDSSNEQLKKRFGDKKIITSFLQKIPGWKSMYKSMLPLYGLAFEQFDFSEFDLVISHGTRFAKAIITKPETVHINYCHTPPRFLWHFSEGFSGWMEVIFTKMRIYDRASSTRVDHYIAGSENAKERIKKIYRVDSKVVYPFVDLDRFKDVDSFNGGYFLVIGRPNKYKRFDLAREACIRLNVELRVITGGLSDKMVVQVIAGCRALIVPGEEDFGLTPLEAQALGKPVIARRAGGALETVVEGKTGVFFDKDEDLIRILEKFKESQFKPEDCKENAAKFSKGKFLNNFKQTIDGLVRGANSVH